MAADSNPGAPAADGAVGAAPLASPVLGELDAWLLAEGRHLRPYEVLGAKLVVQNGVAGCTFALWAPNARAVSVVGDFNGWNPAANPLALHPGCGIWQGFVAGVTSGSCYKYQIIEADGRCGTWRADPYAHRAELRPATASVVHPLPALRPPPAERAARNAADAPISIYEVHTPSWRRVPEDGDRWLSWDELADTLVPYAQDMGFTHLELLPVSEHPFDGSWGYQPTGLYAPTARHGDPEGLGRLVARAHAAGIGVLLDWVPAHFPSDAHALVRLDGTALYEHQDPREGYHPDWNTLIYNLGRTEVANFLIGNALYWIERYGVDGLRVDAVASMLYRDYSRAAGQWVPNVHGGRENLESVAFLQRLNTVLGAQVPQAITVAEESTAWPGVTRPAHEGGLGFHYKWNMGWMHDTLGYFARDPVHRRYHQGDLTFALMYAWSERYVLPLSHDEVVHGKGAMLAKMPGDDWQKRANLRALYASMWAHPGKKLLFMGCEWGQTREWSHERSLDWHELADPRHAGIQRLVRDLNHGLRAQPALHQLDTDPSGFQWVAFSDAQHSVLAWLRWDRDRLRPLLVVCNHTPVVRPGYRVGVPLPGLWREVLNTDAAAYGGGNVGTPGACAMAEPVAWNGQAQSVSLTLPPLAVVWLAPDGA